MNVANFGPIADEVSVYGACRPGHLGGDVDSWARILQSADVGEVLCLLARPEARRWKVPDAYDERFRTHHVPIVDRHLPTPDRLRAAVEALESGLERGNRVAVHCNAGLGRTGVVGAAWLVHAEDVDPRTAVERVEDRPAPRSPREAIRDGNATEDELFDLLATLR